MKQQVLIQLQIWIVTDAFTIKSAGKKSKEKKNKTGRPHKYTDIYLQTEI